MLVSYFALLVAAGLGVAVMYLLARQLGRPQGWFGRRVMPGLLDGGNRTLLDAVLRAVDPRPGERIADVGFGGSHTLRQLTPLVRPERPVGVELSEAMLDAARARCGDDVELHRADVAALPFPTGSLDAVLSVNTNYFWPDMQAALRELRRVLKPGGRLVLGLRSKWVLLLSPVTWFGFRLFTRDQLFGLLDAAGFDASDRSETRSEMIILALSRRLVP